MSQVHPASSTAVSGPQSRPRFEGKTVLIADDDKILLEYLAVCCKNIGFRVETASDGLRTLLKVTKEKPDLLILDLNLPDVEGFRVIERLTDPKFPVLPVIVLTGRSDEASIRRCEDLNAVYAYKGPDTWRELEPLIFDVFQNRASEPPAETEQAPAPRILIIDDNPIALKAIMQNLQGYRLEVIQATSGMQGFWLALKKKPQLIITDYNMDQGSGHYLLGRIKSTPATRHIPVIIYTASAIDKGNMYAIQRTLVGPGQAAAFLTLPLDTPGLIAEIRKHISVRG